MRKIALLVLLVAAVPLASWASSSVDFQNFGGKAYSNASNTILTTKSQGSHYTLVNGLGGKSYSGSNLGRIVFTTGKLTSGSLFKGGTFAAGGSFSIIGSG